MSRRSSPRSTQKALGLPAESGTLYELAITHRSYAFEQPEPIEHNERLEFLGDAILEAVVTDLIFHLFPTLPEGQMARIRAAVVNTNALAELGRSVGVGEHIRLGRGEDSSGGRAKASLLADTFEALIGAVYLDRGIDHLERIVKPLFVPLIRRAHEEGGQDAKGALQETIARGTGGRPSYRVASSGPDHDKTFVAHVYVEDELFGVGSGRSKREAELNAAREALDRLESNEEGRDARAS